MKKLSKVKVSIAFLLFQQLHCISATFLKKTQTKHPYKFSLIPICICNSRYFAIYRQVKYGKYIHRYILFLMYTHISTRYAIGFDSLNPRGWKEEAEFSR